MPDPSTGAEYVAVSTNGSWGGGGKIHAADPSTAEDAYGRGAYYRSLCGQPYLRPSSPSGATTSHPELFVGLPPWAATCKRCVKIMGAQ